MKCKILTLIAFLLVAIGESFASSANLSSSSQSAPQYDDSSYYHTYLNSRFGFYFRYPSYLYALGEPNNGDGNSFFSRDGEMQVSCYAHFQMGGETTQTLLNRARKDCAKEGSRITYEFAKNGKVVVSGYTREGCIFYRKSVICSIYGPAYGGVVDIVAYARLEYKESKRADGDEIIRLLKNFPYLP